MKPTNEPTAKPTTELDKSEDEESSRESGSIKETKLIKNANKLVYKGNVKSRLDAEQVKQSKSDEIPLIDDCVEETGEKSRSAPEESSASQTRSNCEDHPDGHRTDQATDQVTDHSPTTSQSDRPQSNTTVSSDTPSIPADQPAAGLDQPPARITDNFQNISLNDDAVNEPHSGDLCQLDSVEQLNPDEQEEKERLIQQLLELRNTLDDLSNRVSSVREMSFKLTNENNVLNQYVENLMSASSVFVATNATNVKQRRQRK